MNILVTGASGFLGRYLVDKLLFEGEVVTVVGRDKEKLSNLYGENVIVHATDYSYDSLLTLTKGQDAVVHLASMLMQRSTHPLKISAFMENVLNLENLLLACKENGLELCVHTSSISTYNNEYVNTEAKSTRPANIYGVSKLFCDMYGEYFDGQTSLTVTNLRLARLYGFGEREGLMMTDFIHKAKLKQVLTVYGKGNASIEYIYVKDAVEATLKALRLKVGGSFNIGTGSCLSVRQIAETITRIFESDCEVEYLFDKSEAGKGAQMDIGKAKRVLNWSPTWSFEDALRDIKMMMEKENV